jgi:hypothetical protein
VIDKLRLTMYPSLSSRMRKNDHFSFDYHVE